MTAGAVMLIPTFLELLPHSLGKYETIKVCDKHLRNGSLISFLVTEPMTEEAFARESLELRLNESFIYLQEPSCWVFLLTSGISGSNHLMQRA